MDDLFSNNIEMAEILTETLAETLVLLFWSYSAEWLPLLACQIVMCFSSTQEPHRELHN
jgi:hypothetical protein